MFPDANRFGTSGIPARLGSGNAHPGPAWRDDFSAAGEDGSVRVGGRWLENVRVHGAVGRLSRGRRGRVPADVRVLERRPRRPSLGLGRPVVVQLSACRTGRGHVGDASPVAVRRPAGRGRACRRGGPRPTDACVPGARDLRPKRGRPDGRGHTGALLSYGRVLEVSSGAGSVEDRY